MILLAKFAAGVAGLYVLVVVLGKRDARERAAGSDVRPS
jgi:hypothetical protein